MFILASVAVLPIYQIWCGGYVSSASAEGVNAIQESMQENNICKVVADFEKAVWKAVTAVFLDVSVSGCLFHWSQSMWRKTQDLGLAVAYREKGPIQSFIRKLFALPCLPHVTWKQHLIH